MIPISGHSGYRFVQADICDGEAMDRLFREEAPDAVVHFAAESHVDRSIHSPAPVIQTNFNGTFSLLEAARRNKIARFVHVSTDEVYGSIEPPHEADESLSAARQQSLFGFQGRLRSARAFLLHHLQAEHLRHSRFEQLRSVSVSGKIDSADDLKRARGQAAADLWRWPASARLAVRGRPLPRHPLRAWKRGKPGEVYNIGGNCSLPNLEVVHRILKATGKPESLMTRVTDRPGHDRRYALTNEKLTRHTGWEPAMDFERGLRETVDWYITNSAWVQRVKSGEYRQFYDLNYANRTA